MRVVVVAVLLATVTPCSSFGLGSVPWCAKQKNHNIGLRTSASTSAPSASALAVTMSGQASMKASRREILLAAGLQILTAAAAPVFAGNSLDESWNEVLGGSDGKGVDVKFAFPKSWKFERKDGTLLVNDEAARACDADPDKCLLGDVFARSVGGDGVFVSVGTSGETDVSKIPFSFFKKQIFGRSGKFGAYGAPEDVKSLADKTANGLRLVDVKFTAFSPGGQTIARRGIIAVQQAGPEAYMLVCTTSGNRWKNSEAVLRDIANTFSAKATGQAAPTTSKFEGVKASMFKSQNEERQRLEKERAAEGIQ